jgi:tRNA(adenine34) deaminase
MQAITAAEEYLGGKYLNECTLYVTVEPCVMCAGALGWSQVKRVVYGTTDPKRGFQTYAPRALHPKAEVTEGVLQDECARLMTDFFKAKR